MEKACFPGTYEEIHCKICCMVWEQCQFLSNKRRPKAFSCQTTDKFMSDDMNLSVGKTHSYQQILARCTNTARYERLLVQVPDTRIYLIVVRYIVTAADTETENLAVSALLSNLGFQMYSL
jgi:hypothetical protein